MAQKTPDEYLAENVFWVPPEARWSHLQDSAKLPGIGRLIDEAMLAIEKVNPTLKGVLPKDYGRPALNAVMLERVASVSIQDSQVERIVIQ